MPKKLPYTVHSLSSHIENTRKGLSAGAQYNKRPVTKSATSKGVPGVIDKRLFGTNSDDEDSDSSSSGSSDEEGSDFLRKLAPKATKTSAAATRKKSTNNHEIADSEEERRSTVKKGESVQSKRPLKESSSDDSSSESSTKSTKGEDKVRANGAPVKTVTTSSSSSTSSSDSEGEDDESSSEAPGKSIATKTNDPAPTGQGSDDDDSSSESEDEMEPKLSKRAGAATESTNGTTTTTTSETSSSDEESDSEDVEDETVATRGSAAVNEKSAADEQPSDDSSDESEEEEADVSMHIADRQGVRQSLAPEYIAPDFVLRKGDDGSNGQDVARICNQANLQGKQVWYFTVPANLPISVIQNMEIPMNQARGDGIFSHNGDNYDISVDSMTPKSSIQILIPSPDGTRYQPAPRSIDQVMQVKKITQLGNASTSASSVGPAPEPAPRPQPEGLKARYQPFGVNSPMGQIGTDLSLQEQNDTEMTDAPASSAQGKGEKDKKRRQKDKGKGEVETPRNAKRKHGSSEDDAAAAAEQLRGENMSAGGISKKQKTQRVGSPDLGSDAPSSSAVSKKPTLIVPPAIPASTPKPKGKSSKTVTETPASKPRETAVPIPQVPGSSRSMVSPVPVPRPGVTATPLAGKEQKKSKKKKATSDKQQTPPSSAQPAAKSRKTKVTPVPMPQLKTSG